MGFALTAILLKTASVWIVLSVFGMLFAPSPAKALVIALFVAVVSFAADRVVPFKIQGVTRWVIDSGLAALAIYLGQFLWPGAGLAFYTALFAGFVVGAIEIPLHFFLASRFGVRKPQDDKDGIR